MEQIEKAQNIRWKQMGKYIVCIIIGAMIGVATTLGQIDKIIEVKLKEDQVEYNKRKAELIELELVLEYK